MHEKKKKAAVPSHPRVLFSFPLLARSTEASRRERRVLAGRTCPAACADTSAPAHAPQKPQEAKHHLGFFDPQRVDNHTHTHTLASLFAC